MSKADKVRKKELQALDLVQQRVENIVTPRQVARDARPAPIRRIQGVTVIT